MSIENFKAHLNGGIRVNRFEVFLAFPGFAAQGAESEKSRYLCKSAVLPPSTIGVIAVPFRGRQSKHAGDRTFEPWNVTFYADAAMELRNAFERWSNAINNNETNNGLANPNDYTVDAEVHQLDMAGNPIKTYILKNIWPSSVGEMALSTDSTDQLGEFPVTLEYEYWTSNSTVTTQR